MRRWKAAADPYPRARFYEENVYPWSLRRVPGTIMVAAPKEAPHPARTSAIFVVHGMGGQKWTETAVGLRSGFEDALEEIRDWQTGVSGGAAAGSGEITPPPFVLDGYWADYADLEKSFPEDWALFNERERTFFSNLWRVRAVSRWRTIEWYLRQQLGLLSPRVLEEVGPAAWLLYVPLQIIMPLFLVLGLVRHPWIITEILGDVRLYVEPDGIVEHAIVQRIDRRVGEAFLRLIGLDMEYRRLFPEDHFQASGMAVKFDRVVWVAHSLGTVISYNVLSDLFHRAERVEQTGTEEQKEGVRHFRASLRRFVTMGSPLDKIAFLFKSALRPWPLHARRSLIDGGESLVENQPPAEREWWINFFHVLDPVSGALSNPTICGADPPANLHTRFWRIPGLAHVAYWKDLTTLRFILGRTFGKDYLPDDEIKVATARKLSWFAAAAYVVWAVLLVGAAAAIVLWGPTLARWLWTGLKGSLGV